MNLNERLKAHHFTFKKQYGQNFISDTNLLARIADVCDWTDGDVVLEIGPGAGTLTKALSERADRVIAVEIDTRLEPILAESLADTSNVKLIFGDALASDLDALVESELGHSQRYKLVANLPYYITTPLIMHALEDAHRIDELVVMVQKEVGERLCATPGSKTYGAVTVMVQYYANARRAFDVGRKSFTPPPDVDSTILHLTPYIEKPISAVSDDAMRQVVRAAFSQRRKTLRNSLSSLSKDKEFVNSLLAEADIDGGRRAETLSVEEFVRLADVYHAKGGAQ